MNEQIKLQDIIEKLRRRLAREESLKKKAQSIAFESLYPAERSRKEDDLKADVFYLREELRTATAKRDELKRKNEELRAHVRLLELQVKQRAQQDTAGERRE